MTSGDIRRYVVLNRRKFLQAIGIAGASAPLAAVAIPQTKAQIFKTEVQRALVDPKEILANPLTAKVITPDCEVNALALHMTLRKYEESRFPNVPKLRSWLTYTNRLNCSAALLGAKQFVTVITMGKKDIIWGEPLTEDERSEVLAAPEFFMVMDRWEDSLSIRWS
jgi:hypothetical protein